MKLYEGVKKYACVPVTTGLAALASVPAFAEEPVVTSADWAPIISAMTGQISVSTVVGVVATAIKPVSFPSASSTFSSSFSLSVWPMV